MKAYQMTSFWGRAAAVGGVGALLVTVGCGASPNTGVAAQQLAAGQPTLPVVVSCEPNQRTFVRPSVVNGVAVSLVECVSTEQMDAQGAPVQVAAAPVAYRYNAPRAVQMPAGEITDARVIRSSYPATVARPVRTQQVIYDDRPVREVKRGRSVKKSAIIIGSSAGVGAGVGAAVGGKKGALIGAAIGGGGAAIWDQVTRRKN